MRDVSFWPFLWRAVLAISLVAGPVAPVSAAPPHIDKSPPAAMADAMPCHGNMAPSPPAEEAPCDDGCCPQPDCDPGLCRIAGPMIAAFAPVLAAPAPQSLFLMPATIAPPDVFAPPLLRPPIT